jgi:hypothetical protein
MTHTSHTKALQAELRYYVDRIAPDATLLGRIAWFSVFDTTLPHTDLLAAMRSAGVDISFAPKVPADVDVFRRVTTAAQSKRHQNGDGTYSNVLVRDVAADDHKVLRRLVVETVDAKGQRLNYTEAYDLVYDKSNSRMFTTRLTAESTIADSLVSGIVANYVARRGTINAEALRNLIGKVFTAAHSTGLRPTGAVYFTPAATAHLVEGLARLADLIPTMTVHTLPLVDEDGRQAEMVRGAVIDESVVELDAMLAEGKDMLSAGATPRRAAQLLARGKQMRAKAVAYSELLDDNLATMAARLELFDAQMVALMSAVTA